MRATRTFYRTLLLLLLTLPAVGQAQFTYTTNNGTITIWGYTGPGGDVIIPDTINGLPVTIIALSAFYDCDSLTSVTIGTNVTIIGDQAFLHCSNLASVTIGNGVKNIGVGAFNNCSSLTSVTIPTSVTSIAVAAFDLCTRLSSVTIGNGVTTIGANAFAGCSSLRAVCFQGNAPSVGYDVFRDNYQATVYHLPGTKGWGSTFGGRPTALWFLPNPLILDFGPSFGVQTNQFGFIISWATNVPVIVEASTNLANPTWSPVATNTITSGSSYFSDPQWTNYPARFYRIRSP